MLNLDLDLEFGNRLCPPERIERDYHYRREEGEKRKSRVHEMENE